MTQLTGDARVEALRARTAAEARVTDARREYERIRARAISDGSRKAALVVLVGAGVLAEDDVELAEVDGHLTALATGLASARLEMVNAEAHRETLDPA